MSKFERVRQELNLTREPDPMKMRVEKSFHPAKDGENIEQIHGWTKVLKRLREIEKRRSKNYLTEMKAF